MGSTHLGGLQYPKGIKKNRNIIVSRDDAQVTRIQIEKLYLRLRIRS